MRIPRCSLHNHTCYDDGANTPEEVVQGAIASGCEVLGFSGHSHLSFVPDDDWAMSEAQTEQYIADVLALRERYADRIEIALGIEYDSYSSLSRKPYDYVIGSVHHVYRNGVHIPVDLTFDQLSEAVREHYNGDFLALAEDYYRNMYTLVEKTDCDIVAHFDLITKFNEKHPFLDTESARYREIAAAALDHVLTNDRIFEINTGAMARGHRGSPYPDRFLLSRIREKGGRVMITADSHTAQRSMYAYEEATAYAVSCGFDTLWVMKNGEFVPFICE